MKKTNLYLIDGKKVPSVTQILSVVGKPQLMMWYGKLGNEEAKRISDEAKAYGSLIHSLIEQIVNGQDINLADKVKPVLDNFQMITKNWKWLEFEKVLLNKEFMFGGTADAIAEIDGHRTLVDFKTSSGVYPEMHLQMAAYMKCLPEVESAVILHLNKDTNGWELVNSETEGLFEVFLGVKKLFNYMKGQNE
jgi:hypothetical protein